MEVRAKVGSKSPRLGHTQAPASASPSPLGSLQDVGGENGLIWAACGHHFLGEKL